jgi:hypothetical protein
MAETQPVFSVERIAETDLVMPALFVVTALRQSISCVRARHPGIEIRGVIGQRTMTEQLLVSPDRQQTGLRLLEFIFFPAGPDAVKAIPNSWKVHRSAGKPHSEDRMVWRLKKDGNGVYLLLRGLQATGRDACNSQGAHFIGRVPKEMNLFQAHIEHERIMHEVNQRRRSVQQGSPWTEL